MVSVARVSVALVLAACVTGCRLECDLPWSCDIRESSCQRRIMHATACLRGDAPVDVPVKVVNAQKYTDDQARMANESDDADGQRTWVEALSLLRLSKPVPEAGDLARSELTHVAAFYSNDDKRVTVLDRGAALSGWRRVILLVHEFTHALQDRQHDLTKLHDAQVNGSDGSFALSSMIEGEASVLENQAYVQMVGFDLDEVNWTEDYAAYRAQALDRATYSEDPYTERYGDFTYAYGASYVQAALDSGGRDAIDALFRKPPVSSRQVMVGYAEPAPGGSPWIEPDLDREAVPEHDETLSVGSEHMGSFMLEVALGRWNLWAAQEAGSVSAPSESVLHQRDAWAKSALRLRADVLSILASATAQQIAVTWRLRMVSEKDAAELSDRVGFLKGIATPDTVYRVWSEGRDAFIVAVRSQPMDGAVALADAIRSGAWEPASDASNAEDKMADDVLLRHR